MSRWLLILGAGAVVLAGVLTAPGAMSQAWAQRPAFPARSVPAAGYDDPSRERTGGLRADQTALLRQTLVAAGGQGLEADDYALPGLDAQLASRDAATRAQGQRRLMEAVARYARDVHVGRLAAADFSSDWGLRPDPYDAAADLRLALGQDRLAAWLDGLPPPYAGYETLRTGLAAYRRIEAAGGWPAVPAGAALKLGVRDARVPVLRARLAAEDAAVAAVGDATFDEPLAVSVRRAQTRFGLEPTGEVDRATLAALNTPVEARLGQIVANMERWRWLPQSLPADRIQVNIAAAVLTVFKGDTPTLSMRAVTGRPSDMTPMLQSTIHSVVLNPPWNVPAGIAANELYPKGAAYLARAGFVRTPAGLQQKAGPTSALGRVKFDFDNPYSVYLHDTPAKALFDRYGRLASHGCVRLEKAVVLARAVLAGDRTWTPDAIDQAIAGGQTTRVPLSRPVSVFLLYWTAYLGPDGQMNFRADPYGWDRELLQRIDNSPV